MECPHCGRELAAGSSDCPNCAEQTAASGARIRPLAPLEEERAPSRAPRTSRMAIASVGIGILGIFFGLAFGLLALSIIFPALMLGIVSLHEIAQSEGEVKGRALAIAGIVLGVLGFPSMIIMVVL